MHLSITFPIKGSPGLKENKGWVSRIMAEMVNKFPFFHINRGYAVVQLVEALRYKPEARGFDLRWGL